MHVTTLAWVLTIGVTVGLLAVDVFFIGRRPHEPSMRECAAGLALYLSAAVVFGTGVLLVSGPKYGTQFFAGWLTEYSLSADNLFVFLIIMTKMAVPRKLQQFALLIGIVLALVLRGIFIAAGAAAISAFGWVFYLFGGFLVYTAVRLAGEGLATPRARQEQADEFEEGRLLRSLRRRIPSTGEWAGRRLSVLSNGRRLITPMGFVLVALGTTDLLFAMDSIPAIYGLTREPYLVLTANLFALMGLRQLYFLIGGLLRRLVYLNLGLSVLLGFIGVKLVLHALHENSLPFVNAGDPVSWAPDIPTWLSLVVILAVLAGTAVASLARTGPRTR